MIPSDATHVWVYEKANDYDGIQRLEVVKVTAKQLKAVSDASGGIWAREYTYRRDDPRVCASLADAKLRAAECCRERIKQLELQIERTKAHALEMQEVGGSDEG